MSDVVKLPSYLARVVWKKLEAKGIEKRTLMGFLPDCNFSTQELDMIKSLSFCDEYFLKISDLSCFKNLENLNITTTQRTEYVKRSELISIKDEDILEIEKMKNLKILEIDNQQLIRSIDISNFKNLQVLRIINNDYLEEIKGLENNRSIELLDLYNLNSLHKIKDFYKFVTENKNLQELNCDVLYFPDCIGFDYKKQIVNAKALERLQSDELNCSWIEMVVRKPIKINNYQMAKLHQESMKIINKYCTSNDPKDTVVAINRWLSENVKYNHQALNSSLRGFYKKMGDVNILSGPARGANGAYDAIINKCCVCEGFTRGGQYLLKLKDIRSRNVHCIARKDTYNFADKDNDDRNSTFFLPPTGYHSICGILLDENSSFCDFTSNASMFKSGDKSAKYLFLSKEELKETHTLSYNEQKIVNSRPYDKKVIEEYKKDIDKRFIDKKNTSKRI